MDQKTRKLLEDLQQFTNQAVSEMQKGNSKKASFYFNLSAAISAQLSDNLTGE